MRFNRRRKGEERERRGMVEKKNNLGDEMGNFGNSRDAFSILGGCLDLANARKLELNSNTKKS